MKDFAIGVFLLLLTSAAGAQTLSQNFTDAAKLMDVVAKNYASDLSSFHLESATELETTRQLEHGWQQEFHAVTKGDKNRYRFESRTSSGTWLQDSDGTTEWVYLKEAHAYLKRNAGSGPQFPQSFGIGVYQLKQAWEMRTFLDTKAEHVKDPTMLPEQAIMIAGVNYPCYVVHAISEGKGYHTDETFWIEKRTLLFRKVFESEDTSLRFSPLLTIPIHNDITTTYPVIDLGPQMDAKVFAFTPPIDAKEVPMLEPTPEGFSAKPVVKASNKPAPDITLTGEDGKQVKLSSFRGRPLLIDVWATWCAPCLIWMPSLGKLESELRSTGLQVISIDEDKEASTASHYMSVHGFKWPNYHDPDRKLGEAFGESTVPLSLLIDKDGKVVYESTDSDESTLRKAIASLSPPQVVKVNSNGH